MPAFPASLTALVFAVALLGGCSGAPVRQHGNDEAMRERLLAIAMEMLGTPYRYGGRSPREGFDCSGLVQYTHRQAGIDVPRTARAQYNASKPVSRRRLRPGDLVFFRIDGRRISHVGIYLGDGRFIHAPSSGRKVTTARLDDPYWRRHYSGAGRFVP
ncbi:MAG TPA: NlpC/P60 family protein [Gammaproteobacteria bacterium]|nr:NlpC/P60 family protein [Gammaproteobacteria bacterium]